MTTTNRFAIGITLCLALTACAEGEYRLPYVDGTRVEVVQDFQTHTTPVGSMFDMVALDPPGIVAAAAPGWVRFIEDSHAGNGAGQPNNYVWIEHPGDYCQDPGDVLRSRWPGKRASHDRDCIPCEKDFCNEWTVYAHFVEGSVTDAFPMGASLQEGDWVEAGQPIGIEGDVGYAFGVHLHWHVAIIDPGVEPDENGYYEDWSGGAWHSSPELIPVVCYQGGASVLYQGLTYTAGPCP